MTIHAERIVLTVEEAAERLGVGRTLMYALVRSGDIESIAIGRLRRIPLDAWTSSSAGSARSPETMTGTTATDGCDAEDPTTQRQVFDLHRRRQLLAWPCHRRRSRRRRA